MSSFWSTLSGGEEESKPQSISKSRVSSRPSRCADFLHFLAIALDGDYSQRIALHPVLTNSSPRFADASMGGVSFDVRKVGATSFPHGLDDATFVNRNFVVVKQPRHDQTRQLRQFGLDEIAVELQILRHPSIKQHANLLDLLGIVYHNAVDDNDRPLILPGIVVGYADYGDLRSYIGAGYGRSLQDKFEICRDIARGWTSFIVVELCTATKFVVKVSDFGFAISTEDEEPQLTGYTPFWEAPEIHRPLCRSLLPQLDIYSYGLLTYTILKNGALYYDLPNINPQPDHIMKIKTVNLLPLLLQMNLLLTLKNERCMLLIYCKILAYALQADPNKRFASMMDVLQLLTWCDPSDLDESLHATEPTYQIYQFQTSYYEEAKSRLINDFNNHVKTYEVALNLVSPLAGALRDTRYQRFLAEIEMFMRKPGPLDVDKYSCCPGMELMLMRSMLGVLPQQRLAGDSSTVSRPGDTNVISFCQELVPNLKEYHNVLQKVHRTVKNFIFCELEVALKESASDAQRADTMNNLAYCYIEGLGSDADLSKGIQLLHSAAALGSLEAQKQVLEISTAQRQLGDLNQELFLAWTDKAIEETDRQFLCALYTQDPQAYRRKRKTWAIDRMLNVEFTSHSAIENGGSEPDLCASSSWRKKMVHFACAVDLVKLLQQLLVQDDTLLETTNACGQTPVMMAFQSGSIEAARYLLQQGANLATQDLDGISALHWLISFPDSEKLEIAPYLHVRVSNAEPFARFPPNKTKALNVEGAPNATGTPLHWAVACRDLLAVEMLMSMGSEPLRRPDEHTTSPFEQACSLHAAEIVKRMLQDPSVRAAAPKHLPFSGGESRITINAMFHVVKHVSRSQLLARAGVSFEKSIADTIGHLVKAGVSIDSVLCAGVGASNPVSMSATFATAFHQCPVEIMRAGFLHGFSEHLNSTFAAASSNGPAMSLATAHNDLQMFITLINAGASVSWRNMHKQSALSLVAKETDDVRFAERLIDLGVLLDDPTELVSPFYTATYSGNLSVARLLWERGAKRESKDVRGMTVLGALIGMRTRNSIRCIRFLLELPDRDESDGFIVWRGEDEFDHSAFHVALLATETEASLSEDPEKIETSRLVLSVLLEKFNTPAQVDSKIGTHCDTPLGAAVEIGSHHIVRLLLEAGADANAEDEYSRRPLDKLYWRYCYPATLDYLKTAPIDDKYALARRLRYVNENTSEILSLLKSYGAQPNVFRFPAWHESNPGYRDVDWVAARLRERRDAPSEAPSTVPTWGGLPITIPERPRQFESQRRLAARSATDKTPETNQPSR